MLAAPRPAQAAKWRPGPLRSPRSTDPLLHSLPLAFPASPGSGAGGASGGGWLLPLEPPEPPLPPSQAETAVEAALGGCEVGEEVASWTAGDPVACSEGAAAETEVDSEEAGVWIEVATEEAGGEEEEEVEEAEGQGAPRDP